MLLRRYCWFVWLAGAALIALSWGEVVPPQFGWAGLGACLAGMFFSLLPRLGYDLVGYPISEEGLPIEPPGVVVGPDAPLGRGDPVLAFSQGRWWRARVEAIRPDGQVRVSYPGWDPGWHETHDRARLQFDTVAARNSPAASWGYRVLARDGQLAVHEVYYAEGGRVAGYTAEPVCPRAESVEALAQELMRYRLALAEPVLEFVTAEGPGQPGERA